MIKIETLISQVLGLATFQVYDDAILVTNYSYNDGTKLTSLSAIANDLTMPFEDYVRNVGILERWVQDLESSFFLVPATQIVTSRNYDYDYSNHFRRVTAIVDGNEFKVRYNYNAKNIIVKARGAFLFNFSQLFYFTKCHTNFYSKNDLF